MGFWSQCDYLEGEVRGIRSEDYGGGKRRHYYTILVDEPTGPRLYQDVPQGEIRPLWKAPGV